MPETVGAPLIVNTLFDHIPLKPEGSPDTVAPVAPVVAKVIFVNAEFKQTVCESVPAAELSEIVFLFTVMVPVAVVGPQPPMVVMV